MSAESESRLQQLGRVFVEIVVWGRARCEQCGDIHTRYPLSEKVGVGKRGRPFCSSECLHEWVEDRGGRSV